MWVALRSLQPAFLKWLLNRNKGSYSFEWAKDPKALAEVDLIGCMIRSMLGTNEAIDRFVNWMFAGTGAVAGVLIANVDSAAPFLSTRGLYWIFILLGISAIFGLLAKVYGLRNKISSDSLKVVLEDIKPVIEKHIEVVSLEEFLGIVSKTFIEVIPLSVKVWVSYVLFRASEDHLYVSRKLAARFQKQIITASLQLVFLIAVVFVAAGFVARGPA